VTCPALGDECQNGRTVWLGISADEIKQETLRSKSCSTALTAGKVLIVSLFWLNIPIPAPSSHPLISSQFHFIHLSLIKGSFQLVLKLSAALQQVA